MREWLTAILTGYEYFKARFLNVSPQNRCKTFPPPDVTGRLPPRELAARHGDTWLLPYIRPAGRRNSRQSNQRECIKMSAYVVDKKTIDRIVTYIFREYGYRDQDILHRYYPQLVAENENVLGQRLWKLNVDAVNCRYEENNPVELYQWSPEHCGLIQTLKSLQCLIYQCAEGNIPDTNLYKDLERLEKSIMSKIIDALPEYNAAQWG
jgi:hypothetical protein